MTDVRRTRELTDDIGTMLVRMGVPYDCTLQPDEIAKILLGLESKCWMGMQDMRSHAAAWPPKGWSVSWLLLIPAIVGKSIRSLVMCQRHHIPKGSGIGQIVIAPVISADFVTELGKQ